MTESWTRRITSSGKFKKDRKERDTFLELHATFTEFCTNRIEKTLSEWGGRFVSGIDATRNRFELFCNYNVDKGDYILPLTFIRVEALMSS